jgi:hypothetical protein
MRGILPLLAIAASCGDNAAPGPHRLVSDPKVEVGCLPGPLAAGTVRAKVVACAAELIGGRLAGGRVGDFVLENERVRVIVRGAGEGFYQHGSSGGGIVDAATVGGEDLVKEILPAVDLSVGAFDELVITEAGDDGPAEIVVRGPATGLDIIRAALTQDPPAVIIEHHYRLSPGADAVELETRVFPQPGAEPAASTLYDAMFLGGRARAFLPGKGWASGQGAAEMIATAGTTSSYGLVFPADAPNPQLIDLAGIRLVQGPGVDATGLRRWLVIGDGSVSSVTDRGWALRGTTTGDVSGTTAPGVDVVIADTDGNLLTIARADASGAFRAAVPPGDYTLHAEALGRDNGPDVAVTVAGGSEVVQAVAAGPGGSLAIAVHDDAARPIPARVLIERANADSRVEWVGATGAVTLPIAPGTWRVSISRGLEYDAFVATALTVADGQRVPLDVELAHVVDTAGWISLDTHLHSELSTDSTFPVDDRLRAVAGEGVEVPVSADHDFITDYAPIISELGLTDWLGSLTGEEASSIVWGHINAWPLAVQPDRTGAGAPHWRGKSPGEVFAALRGSDSMRIVQVNHPRRSSGNLFNAIDLDPGTLTARRDPSALGLPSDTDLSDLSFDAVEVANALSENDFEQVFGDWLALVTAGHPAAATGSSDSHGPTGYAGEARTYVWVGLGADDPTMVDPSALGDAIRARHVVVGTGAFVTAGIVGPTSTSIPGDIVDVTGMAQVKLHVRVQAAAWQPLAGIRVFEKTHQVAQVALDPGDTSAVRFDADITLPTPTADTLYVVRVDRGGRGDPVIGEMMPAFTNPVFAHVQ